MPISPDRLERYKDFVDPEHTEISYDPRQGLERLMGVLSPDPKGIVLAAMGEDWYGSNYQLRSRVFSFLEELRLPVSVWPITRGADWSYIQHIDKNSGQIVDGSLVGLGAVVKKIEQGAIRLFYQRSLAGAELAVPVVQRAVNFVSKAREYTERQRLHRQEFPKFDSMWRIVGAVNSPTNQRRPLAIFDIVDFLTHNPGKHRQIDLQNKTQISRSRLETILPSLGNFGIIDYTAPQIEIEGHPGRGWSVYTLINSQSVANLNTADVYQSIRETKGGFRNSSYLARIIDYIKEHPEDEHECWTLAKKLRIRPHSVSEILSLLSDLEILIRPDPGFKGSEVQSAVSANDLTHLFYDLVGAPVKELADTLSPLPLRPWEREKVAIYLQNYNVERSHNGPQGGADARRLLLGILSQVEGEMKFSHIVDVYNERTETALKDSSFRGQLKILMGLGLVEQPKLGYYRLVHK